MHAHATVFNATYDGVEKRWKPIQLGDIVRDKGYYQAAFHARMAHCPKDLGCGIEREGNSFRIAGIDRSTVEKFSQRTAVIEREAERLGIKDAASKSKLGRRTRERKGSQDVSMEELRKKWDARLSPEERLAIKTARNGSARGDHDVTPEQKTVRNDELAFLQFALDGQRRQKALLQKPDMELLAGLSAEQKKAVLHILTSRDTVTGSVGKAGTGKTTMMRATR